MPGYAHDTVRVGDYSGHWAYNSQQWVCDGCEKPSHSKQGDGRQKERFGRHLNHKTKRCTALVTMPAIRKRGLVAAGTQRVGVGVRVSREVAALTKGEAEWSRKNSGKFLATGVAAEH